MTIIMMDGSDCQDDNKVEKKWCWDGWVCPIVKMTIIMTIIMDGWNCLIVKLTIIMIIIMDGWEYVWLSRWQLLWLFSWMGENTSDCQDDNKVEKNDAEMGEFVWLSRWQLLSLLLWMGENTSDCQDDNKVEKNDSDCQDDNYYYYGWVRLSRWKWGWLGLRFWNQQVIFEGKNVSLPPCNLQVPLILSKKLFCRFNWFNSCFGVN